MLVVSQSTIGSGMSTQLSLTLHNCKKWGIKTFKLKNGTKNVPDYPKNDNSWKKHSRIHEPTETFGNIAMCMGEGYFAVDIDIGKDGGPKGIDVLRKFMQERGLNLPATVRAITSSGGQHILYEYDPKEYFIPNYQGRFGKELLPSLDIRGENGYIVAPGSRIDGREYYWDELNTNDFIIEKAPDWLCEMLNQDEPVSRHLSESYTQIDEYAWEDVKHALKYIDPSLSEPEWWTVCAALVATGKGPIAFQEFDTWSSGSKTKYTKEATIRKWNQVNARLLTGVNHTMIFKIAKNHGWDGSTPDHEALHRKFFPFAYNGESDPDFKKAMETAKLEPDPLPYIPFPHFKKLCEDIYNHCIFKYPNFAIHSALAAIGYCAQNKWLTHTGFPLNLYQIIMAPTGAGKEQYASVAQEIITNSLCDNAMSMEEASGFFAGIPSSSAAIVREIAENPRKSMILLEKEADIIFKNKLNMKTNPQADSLATALMKLYDSKDTTLINGEIAKSKAHSSVSLLGGAFSIFASCTTASAPMMAQGTFLDTGMLNRCFLVTEEPVTVVNSLTADWAKPFDYDRDTFKRMNAEYNSMRQKIINDCFPEDMEKLSRLAIGYQEKLASQNVAIKHLVSRIAIQSLQVASLIAIYEKYASNSAKMPMITTQYIDFAFRHLKINSERFIGTLNAALPENEKPASDRALEHIKRIFESDGSESIRLSAFTKHAPKKIGVSGVKEKLADLEQSQMVEVTRSNTGISYRLIVPLSELL